MSKFKFKSGHSSSCYEIWKYLLYDKKTGKRRAVDEKVYNVRTHYRINNNGEYNTEKDPWWKEFDDTRHEWGTDVDINGKKTTHFIHFMLSPDPKDNISSEEFMDYIDEFLDKGFHTQENGGAFQIAVVLHNDNRILHAHIVVNNTILDNTYVGDGNRLSSYLGKNGQILHQISGLRNYLAEKRGWNTFLEKDVEDARQAMVESYINQGKDPEKYAEEINARIKDIFDNDREFFEKHKGVDINANYSRPYRQVPYGPIKSTRHSSYIKPQEAAFISKYGWSYKDDLRELIDLAISLSRDIGDFERILKYYGVEYKRNNKNDFVFKHPNSNVRYRGYGLGRDYTRKAIYKRINTVYKKAKRQQDWKVHNNYAKGLSGSGIVAVYHLDKSIRASDLRELIDINMKYNIWKDDEYELNLKYVDKEEDPEKYADLKWASKKIKRIRNPRGYVPRDVTQRIRDDIVAMPKRAKDMTDEEIIKKVKETGRQLTMHMLEEDKKKKRKRSTGQSKSYDTETTSRPTQQQEILEPERRETR